MAVTRDDASASAISASYRDALRRPGNTEWKLLVAVGLFVLVLIADAALIARAAPDAHGLATLYTFTA